MSLRSLRHRTNNDGNPPREGNPNPTSSNPNAPAWPEATFDETAWLRHVVSFTVHFNPLPPPDRPSLPFIAALLAAPQSYWDQLNLRLAEGFERMQDAGPGKMSPHQVAVRQCLAENVNRMRDDFLLVGVNVFFVFGALSPGELLKFMSDTIIGLRIMERAKKA